MKFTLALILIFASTGAFAQERTFTKEQTAKAQNSQKPAADAPATDPHAFVTEKTLDAALTDKDRIIIVDVGAELCGWCKKLEADSLPAAEKKYGDQLRIYHIDDTHGDAQAWVEKHHVTYSLPGITLVRNGRVLSRSHGYREPEQFLNWIRNGLNGQGEFHGDETEETKLILSKDQIETLEKGNKETTQVGSNFGLRYFGRMCYRDCL